jgi:hypothetical protein
MDAVEQGRSGLWLVQCRSMWLAFAAQRQLALDAKKAMFSRLFASLGESVAKPVPAGADDNASLSRTNADTAN